jgi:hypothetical protein
MVDLLTVGSPSEPQFKPAHSVFVFKKTNIRTMQPGRHQECKDFSMLFLVARIQASSIGYAFDF